MSTKTKDYPERILVIEDDESIRRMLVRVFGGHSQILEATNGEAGLRAFREDRPDFVITDLMLPGVDGVEVIRQARRSYWGACVPILVITANTAEDILLQCFREGADDFVVKPFSLLEMRMRVSSIYLRQEVARDVNPLSRMPGNLVIKREMQRRLDVKTPFALATLDLDHFKPFNDARGFEAGDEVIKLMGEILNAWAANRAAGGEEIFVGHVGGDDYVALLPPNEVQAFADFVHTKFEERALAFYSKEERASGLTKIKNRNGEDETVPLLSVSIGVVLSDRPGNSSVHGLGHSSAEVKKVAKAIPGNSLFVDRRKTADLPANDPCPKE